MFVISIIWRLSFGGAVGAMKFEISEVADVLWDPRSGVGSIVGAGVGGGREE
jgi:hypothetical protein